MAGRAHGERQVLVEMFIAFDNAHMHEGALRAFRGPD
jgi:hypothetical protein